VVKSVDESTVLPGPPAHADGVEHPKEKHITRDNTAEIFIICFCHKNILPTYESVTVYPIPYQLTAKIQPLVPVISAIGKSTLVVTAQ